MKNNEKAETIVALTTINFVLFNLILFNIDFLQSRSVISKTGKINEINSISLAIILGRFQL